MVGEAPAVGILGIPFGVLCAPRASAPALDADAGLLPVGAVVELFREEPCEYEGGRNRDAAAGRIQYAGRLR